MADGDKKFGIMRIAKITGRSAVRNALKHNLRQLKNDKSNIDPERTHLNVTNLAFDTYDKCKKRFEENLSEVNVRKNAVMLHEIVITMSPEQAKKMSKKEMNQYFRDALKWGSSIHGGAENLVSFHIHHDEKTPHMHMLYTPIVKNDKGEPKLASRSILGNIDERRKPTSQELAQNRVEIEDAKKKGLKKIPKALIPDKNNVFVLLGSAQRMSDYQTDFYNKVGKKSGLDRGIKKSITGASHTPLKEQHKDLEIVITELMQTQKQVSGDIDIKLDKLSKINSKLEILSNQYQGKENGLNGLESDIERLNEIRQSAKNMTLDALRKQIASIEQEQEYTRPRMGR
jgi:archaellum component FlaC